MKIKIVQCSDHDHAVVFLNDEIIIQDDNGTESISILAQKLKDHYGWEYEIETIDSKEFEKRYA